MNSVTAAAKAGVFMLRFGFRISFNPGMIIAQDRTSITVIAEVIFKNNSIMKGKL